ncbi:hypothetical protein ABFS82_05G002900 [Erythranthe guttata]|uniref:uncharacterized protein LOC105952648 n=1 Tax=Erythranthe guttata TaxID=4155 RepID=UPI00064DD59D|nr:PREDICTED: uncharacterized protein LOC105952648 [Erythranthe guttata]XP_012831681.1 PREDICTED: uncharacterized protein LOC105952648 [Erythranthe guttata]XP_012831682.1 PREDICTED: uncharacterized protein LOC105952648 [Erythranthe guttata]|eukprot:XP_012831680.1 PREDICTED: uncharacterized protein LOC105952648 [Erythranthe guttata]
MVLGIRSKLRRRSAVKVTYIIHVQELMPWPPSESLRSVQTVFLQWENGNQYSGSFHSTAQDSKIVFNESFKLPVILHQEKKAHDKFQKNYLEFSLFAPRKDKSKGQLLGTAVLNLADYGVIEHALSTNVSINLKKSSNKSVQPVLVIRLEPVENESASSSPNVGLSKEPSLDNVNDDDDEIASFTDDDASSHSSRTAGSSTFEAATFSPSQSEKNGNGNSGFDLEQSRGETGNQENDSVRSSKFYERSTTSVEKKTDAPVIRPSYSSISRVHINGVPKPPVSSFVKASVSVEGSSLERFSVPESVSTDISDTKVSDKSNSATFLHLDDSREKELKPENVEINDPRGGLVNVDEKMELIEKLSEDAIEEPESDTYADEKALNSDISDSCRNEGEFGGVTERKESIHECRNECKSRIEMLEEELREAAASEIGLYSVVAEHASSGNKVHAPARRLSRFYSNSCKEGSQGKRASAARAAVSGLVLVSKSCGHDVPRLTFWLSNSIMLRAVVSKTAAELPGKIPHDLEEQKSKSIDETDDMEDVSTFIIALEKVESWLFSRIVESLWWQTFTPHMQPTFAKSSDVTFNSGTKKTIGRRNSIGNYEQGNFSMELWKKAFKDAFERLCPVRAGGHECGCLSVLVRLVMEQLVNRLDMAMFNAILRESAEEMPTDPLSDPISDSKVLPIPAGKSSFGAGVELKNCIGNWSRGLTDLFGLEEDSIDLENEKSPKSFKAFRLLHALSDLMMLPPEMLADTSIRKEICPMFGPTIVKRVLNSYTPDEFCPDPVPQNIIDALDNEEFSDDMLTTFPCNASPTKYSPPSAALLTCVGEVGSQVIQSSRLSSLKKSYISDDELDELDSPFTSSSFFKGSALAKLSFMPKEKGGRNIIRYQLLREIWKDDE